MKRVTGAIVAVVLGATSGQAVGDEHPYRSNGGRLMRQPSLYGYSGYSSGTMYFIDHSGLGVLPETGSRPDHVEPESLPHQEPLPRQAPLPHQEPLPHQAPLPSQPQEQPSVPPAGGHQRGQ